MKCPECGYEISTEPKKPMGFMETALDVFGIAILSSLGALMLGRSLIHILAFFEPEELPRQFTDPFLALLMVVGALIGGVFRSEHLRKKKR